MASSGLFKRCGSPCGGFTKDYLQLGYECWWRTGNPEAWVVDSDEGNTSSPTVFTLELMCSRTHIIRNSVSTRLASCQLTFFMIGNSGLGEMCVCTISGFFTQLVEERSICLMRGRFPSLCAKPRYVTTYNTGSAKSPPLAAIPFESSEGVSLP
jgi:hypothetical protein